MKQFDFTKYIKNNILLKEATLVNKRSSTASSQGDLVMFRAGSDDNYGSNKKLVIGRITKALANDIFAIEAIAPASSAGNIYKEYSRYIQKLPSKGQTIVATASYNQGAGSGSSGTNTIQGTVLNVDIKNLSITIENDMGETKQYSLNNLSGIKIM